jgi:EAL domain-containing protein (putative c-di-GMP-specific phosphodiesterase class I)
MSDFRQNTLAPGLARTGCVACREGQAFPVPFSMAYQPIIDAEAGTVFAYEALVRGPEGQGAGTVLSAVDETNRYAFDQACRVTAIETAARLDLPATGAMLSINFLPNAVYEPRACIRSTLNTAERTGFPTDRLMFEIVESEEVHDHAKIAGIIAAYRAMGFKTALDDFGAGFSNLNLLARFQPDIIKLDMELIRDIDRDRVRQAIVRGIIAVCRDLDITTVCEGVETFAEYECLRDGGVNLFQGYLFAKPGFESLPAPVWPAPAVLAAVA